MWGVRYANRLKLYMKTTGCFELQAMRSDGILAMFGWTTAPQVELLASLFPEPSRVHLPATCLLPRCTSVARRCWLSASVSHFYSLLGGMEIWNAEVD